jgi:hypothetical protein
VSDEQFDELARGFAGTTSRRQAVKLLAGAPRAGAHHKPGHCKDLGRHCGNNRQCCSGFCDREQHICRPAPGCGFNPCGPVCSNGCPSNCFCCSDSVECGSVTGQCVTC